MSKALKVAFQQVLGGGWGRHSPKRKCGPKPEAGPE